MERNDDGIFRHQLMILLRLCFAGGGRMRKTIVSEEFMTLLQGRTGNWEAKKGNGRVGPASKSKRR
jgi:hypothetical protein